MGLDAVRGDRIDLARHHDLEAVPAVGCVAIGILLGIKLFFVGLIMVMGGSAVRSMAK